MVADDVGGDVLDPRHFGTHAAPVLADAPHQAGSQLTPDFDQHHAQLGEFREHAFGDKADELRREGLRLAT